MMLISKIVKNRPLIIQFAAFSYFPGKANDLNRQILQSKSWKEFYQVFSNNKSGFTEDTFQLASRYISNLLSRQKEYVNYGEIRQVIAVISQFQVSSLTEANTISLLACLRSFCMKGIQMNSIYKIKNQLCSHYTNMIIAKPQGKQNFSELIYGYYEMSFFGWLPGCRITTEKIMNRVNSESGNSNILTFNQSTFLLNAFATKADLSIFERRLRSYILKSLIKQIDTLKFADLVSSLISLNKMDFHDATPTEITSLKILGTKMLQNISELQEKLIFQFLKGDRNNQHPVFFRIYEELLKNTYAEVYENGDTSFDQKTMLNLFSHLSSRFNFARHSQGEKRKYYNFLKNATKQFKEANDTQGIRLLHNTIEETIRNRYYDQTKTKQLVRILFDSDQPIRLSLLETLYYNRFEVNELLPSFLSNATPQTISNANIIRLSTILNRIKSNPQYEAFKNSIEDQLSIVTTRVEQMFESWQKFTQQFLNLFRNPSFLINYKLFHITDQEYFSKLINPFQADQQSFNFQYRLAYLQYVIHAFKSKDFYKFVANYNQKIGYPVIIKVIYSNIHEDSRRIQPSKYILHLILKNLNAAFENKQKQFLNATIQLVNKYNRYVVRTDRDFELAKNIIKIINIYLAKIQILTQLELSKIFFDRVSRYLIKSVGNYKNEDIFREIIAHSLRIIDQFPNYLVVQILREGFRMNLIEKKAIEKINSLQVYKLNQYEKESLDYILDNTFTPQVKVLNQMNLQALFFNHNLNSVIEQRQSEINQIIQKVSVNTLFSYLVVFNQPKSKVSERIVAKIIQRINSYPSSIQRCDFQGAMKNLLEKGLNTSLGCKELAERVVYLLNSRMNIFSIWTHTQTIRFIISIPTYNPTDYYNRLVEYTEKNFSEAEIQQVIYRLSYTNYSFKPQDLRHVKPLLKKSLYKGTFLFLVTQNLHGQAERKQIVTEIAKRLTDLKEYQNPINTLQYEYLKKAYPQQTKDLNISHEGLLKNIYFQKPRQKVIDLFEQIAKAHQTTIQTLPAFQENYIAKINNFCIAFYYQKRTGSYHQHEFIKRALALYFNEQGYKFVLLGFAKINKLLEYIQKIAPQLITPEVKVAATQYLQQNKPQKEEEQQQLSNPKAERQQNYEKRERKFRQAKSKPLND